MKGRKASPTPAGARSRPKACPPPPVWLSPQAKAEWRRVAPELHRRNLLAPDTIATLENYCAAVGMVRASFKMMGDEPVKAEGAHPATRLALASMREARLLAAELALTPHRRGKQGEAEETDEWEGMLA